MSIKVLSDEVIYDGRFIQVIKRKFSGRDGRTGVWEMVKRKTYGRIVAVAAITPEKEILLEKIFRVPLNSYTLELPAGLMDVAGESELEAIRRELLEETGYVSDHIEFLTGGPFNPGLVADELAIYLARDIRLVSEPKLENSEDIEVIKVPLKDLLNFLSSQKTHKPDVKIATVIPHLMKLGLMEA